MTGSRDLSRLIGASANSFNEARAALATSGVINPTIRAVRPIIRDLSEHQIDGIFFMAVVFKGAPLVARAGQHLIIAIF